MWMDVAIGPPAHSDLIIPCDPDFQSVLCTTVDRDAKVNSGTMMRYYDYGVRQWLQGVTLLEGRILPVFKSTPMRAFATYAQLLEKGALVVQPFRRPSDAQLDVDKCPAPFITFERGSPSPRLAERNVGFPVRNMAFLQGSSKRRTAYTRYPKPIDLPYQIDIWCKYESHSTYLWQQVESQFMDSHARWLIETPYRDQNFIMALRFASWADNTELDSDNDRLLRFTISVVAEAWMWFDIKAAPTFLTLAESDGSGPSDPNLTTTTTKLVSEAPPTLAEQAKFPTTAPVPAPTAD